MAQLDSKGETNSAFFRHNKSGDEFTNFIISSLSHADDSVAFTGDFVNTYGIPKWGIGFSINAEDRSSLIIPILDEDNQFISALYYLKYKNNYIETYILMNDEDDIAYDETKHLIQFFETKLGLERSNKDFEIIEPSGLKYSAIVVEECYSWWQVATFSDGSFYARREQECSIGTEVIFDGYSSGGSWANSGGGNYPPNGSYGGGKTGGTDPIPDPVPEILPTPQFLENEKLKCVWEKINNILANNNSSLLTSIFSEFSGLNFNPQNISINLVDDIILDNGKSCMATCVGDGDNYLININEKGIGASSPIEIAYTLAHEMLHAHLWRMYKTTDENFIELFSKYVTVRHGVKDLSQHEVMRRFYIPALANILRKFDAINGEVNPDNIYTNLSWSGLQGVLPDSQQQKIIDAKNFVRNLGTDCK